MTETIVPKGSEFGVSSNTADVTHDLLVVCDNCRRILYSAVGGHIPNLVARNTAYSHSMAFKNPHKVFIIEKNYVVTQTYGERDMYSDWMSIETQPQLS